MPAELTALEMPKLLSEWNDTATDYPRQTCIHELFERQAAATPTAVALVWEGGTLSYQELNVRANRLAHHLIGLGVKAGSLAGLCLERSADLVVGVLAVLKAGGAYVPLDPAYPLARLDYMLEDAAPRVLLTQRPLLEGLPAFRGSILCLDEFDWDGEEGEIENPASQAKPEDLAYVIYTSGSTGRPKGTCVEHRSVVCLVVDTNYVEIDATDVVGHISSCSFDAATFEIWGALLNGAKLVIINKEVALSPRLLAAAIERHAITTMFVTTALFNTLAELAPAMLGRLRHLLFGGEAVSPRWVSAVLGGSPPERLLHVYGPTETTTFASWHLVTEVAKDATTVPIGRPLSNTQLYVLDAERQPVSIGEPGELYIGGDGVARGYLNQPELTDEKFIQNPFGTGRVYRTGDRVRFLPDGCIEFLGRVDDQVKLRGFRIELGEIESVLVQHPQVKSSAVVLREDVPGEKFLAAFVVPADGDMALQGAVREHLRENLPAQMMPTSIVVLAELPLSPNGKVDRQALAGIEIDQPQNAHVEPQTPVERELARIWADVLSLDRVSRDGNFFDLGGHSLTVTRAISRIRDEMSVDLDFKSFYDTPVVSDLAAHVASQAGRLATPTEIEVVPRNGPLPLSYSQERVWFVNQLNPSNRAYHFQVIYRLTGALNVNALEKSLSEIVARHEIFRTTFLSVDGKPLQQIHEPEPLKLIVEDLRARHREDREHAVQRRLQEEARRLFDLGELPLVRWVLLQIDDAEYALIHVEHHIVHDGWSFNVFLEELVWLYNANVASSQQQLPRPSIQFADFAQWQRKWMEGSEGDRQRDYWREKLRGIPQLLELPLDHPRPPAQSFNGAAIRREIPGDLSDQIRWISKQEGVSPFVTLLAAFVITLYRYSGQEDICVGVGFANRRSRQVEDLIGMIINNVVVRARLSQDTSVRALLSEIQENVVEASANQDLPFDQVVDAVRPERTLSHNPLFQVMFGLHDAPMPKTGFADVNCELDLGLNNESAKFDLNVTVFPASARKIGQPLGAAENPFELAWEFNTDLFERETIARMQAHYEHLLTEAVQTPGCSVSQLPMLSGAERDLILTEWNDTSAEFPREACVHELFEQQAASTPSAVAVVHAGEELSYGELNVRANRLAHHLIELGVTTNTLVGVCLERSLDMMVGLLAVLKAGGAYVPIDPEYPSSRLEQMLEDAAPAVLLTQTALKDRLPAYDGHPVCLDAEILSEDSKMEKNPPHHATPENLVYVIFTSGSTGRPKGVMIPHRALVNLLVDMQQRLEFSAEERLLAVTTLSFDIAALELFLPLISGARLIIASRETAMQGDRLLQELNESGTTVMQATPATWRMLLQTGWDRSGDLKVLCGGEALPTQLAEQLLKTLGAPFWNVYGPTEATVWSTAHLVERVDGPVSIGRALANTQVYILDVNLEPVAIGAPGDLYLGGDGLAHGYLNQPELTAERFVSNPFDSDGSSRMYRTGDRARYLANGDVEFLGRSDHQIKLRGHRIELGEIETALYRHEGVKEAAVLLREADDGEKYIAAYVVPTSHDPGTLDGIREQVKARLPTYMIPNTILELSAFPLSPNGKLDRNALPKPDRENALVRAPYVAPRTASEESLAAIWRKILGCEKIGVEDDFFALGGHSLMATQLASRVMDSFGVEIPLRAFFESPSIARLAGIIEARAADPEAATAPLTPIRRSKRRG